MPSAELAEYFTAERQGGFLLVAVGLAGFGYGAFLWVTRSAFLAMAWPLVVLGLFQVAIEPTVALRTPEQVASLEQDLRTSPAATVSAETQRMSTVNRNFRVIKLAEVAFIVLGLLLAVFLPHPSTWAAVGLGLLVGLHAMAARVRPVNQNVPNPRFDSHRQQRRCALLSPAGQLRP